MGVEGFEEYLETTMRVDRKMCRARVEENIDFDITEQPVASRWVTGG